MPASTSSRIGISLATWARYFIPSLASEPPATTTTREKTPAWISAAAFTTRVERRGAEGLDVEARRALEAGGLGDRLGEVAAAALVAIAHRLFGARDDEVDRRRVRDVPRPGAAAGAARGRRWPWRRGSRAARWRSAPRPPRGRGRWTPTMRPSSQSGIASPLSMGRAMRIVGGGHERAPSRPVTSPRRTSPAPAAASVRLVQLDEARAVVELEQAEQLCLVDEIAERAVATMRPGPARRTTGAAGRATSRDPGCRCTPGSERRRPRPRSRAAGPRSRRAEARVDGEIAQRLRAVAHQTGRVSQDVGDRRDDGESGHGLAGETLTAGISSRRISSPNALTSESRSARQRAISPSTRADSSSNTSSA